MGLSRMNSGHYRRTDVDLPIELCFFSPEKSCGFPPIVTYETIRIKSGHYRRVLHEAGWEAPPKKHFKHLHTSPGELHYDERTTQMSRGASHRVKEKRLPSNLMDGSDSDLHDRLESILNEADAIGEAMGINCELLFPFCSGGLGCFEEPDCGFLLNNERLCCGDAMPTRSKRLYLLQEAVDILQTQVNALHTKLHTSLEEVSKLSLREPVEEAARRAEELRAAESKLIEERELTQRLEAELQESKTSEEDSKRYQEEIERLQQITQEKEDALNETIAKLEEQQAQQKPMEETEQIATQTNISYFNQRRDNRLMHGIEVKAVIKDEGMKVISLRLEYELRSIVLGRNHRIRILPLALMRLMIHERSDFEIVLNMGALSENQVVNDELRVAIFGYSAPLVLEFYDQDTRQLFIEHVNYLTETIAAERNKASNDKYEEEARQIVYDIFRGKETTEGLNAAALTQSVSRKDSANALASASKKIVKAITRAITMGKGEKDKSSSSDSRPSTLTASDVELQYLLHSPRSS